MTRQLDMFAGQPVPKQMNSTTTEILCSILFLALLACLMYAMLAL